MVNKEASRGTGPAASMNFSMAVVGQISHFRYGKGTRKYYFETIIVLEHIQVLAVKCIRYSGTAEWWEMILSCPR